ncbi:3-oxoacyl-ACP reductase [Naematelia encephala]|uniref:3-oxoacyl-ACP reductase n=1 Tax=Naematelia encephala TaxID=71784 RepID=A0A1Y2AEN6_9TREE|nr:3-oxoacyl-ACP reductase [Naematelia encephala]
MLTTSLEGKVAVVTGAASGIGLATVEAFLESGILGVCMVDLNESTLSSAVSSLRSSFSDRIISITGDVSEEATADSYVAAVMKKWGRLDVSVQCAGINMKRAPVMEVSVEVLDRIWRVNVRGVFLGLQKSIGAMLEGPSKGRGCSIILISSQIGLDGCAGLSAYAASKFAVRGLMSTAAQEYGPMGIRINAVCPGPIDTPLIANIPAELMKPHVEKCNLKRTGKAEEIASAVLFLASEAGGYCSGTTLKVDGGWSKWS